MAPIVELITTVPSSTLGEGPHWDRKTQSLIFVDIFGKSIHKYVPGTGQHAKAQLEKPPSAIVPVEGKENQFVCGLGKEIVIITWDGQSEKVSKIEKISEVEPETKNNLNDGKCDSKGRLWIGTVDSKMKVPESSGQPKEFTDASATLVLLDGKKVSTQATGITCSNGLAWNKNNDKFYYIDTFTEKIDVYDFDLDKGISNRRVLFTPSKHGITGFPDGMTIDEDENLWVAMFNGFSVLKIDAKKPENLLQKIEIPAKQVTSVAWGGVNLDELYVTTGMLAMNGEEFSPPANGALYKVTNLGTRGLPAENFVL